MNQTVEQIAANNGARALSEEATYRKGTAVPPDWYEFLPTSGVSIAPSVYFASDAIVTLFADYREVLVLNRSGGGISVMDGKDGIVRFTPALRISPLLEEQGS